MGSQLDSDLPLPAFCKQLNWPTSAAFRIRWVAITPVHFHHVGGLNNLLNLDDDGMPRTVIIGRDGQEISEDAGHGVVSVLNDAERADQMGRR